MHSADHNHSVLSLHLRDEAATAEFARRLAPLLAPGIVVWLDGDLGSGKTTLVRAMLRACGHTGPVKSPTFALVEIYVISRIYWYHFDFYRFNFPEEFLDAGLGEYFRDDAVCLVEWPQKAAGYLPPPDLVVSLHFAEKGRRIEVSAASTEGRECLKALTSREPPGAG
ncbi:tRNA (adenosine(37)-N6)-threonylcarbamoyltransferase complex ATPase subunit type 1 TsaE [Accumulibacter sp.]|uniref:tRNA (adenosine(37)-N6)-threonylcarbamoyltransferase complex ATPase subunit type 1 TsaE n=1 Tax=Accumulibacter sp. TaxID=2053492 RepID=UPI0025EB3F9E|nr:tRNA (adenosine(37)-N6)-threonylcarbamoyltransferase complex ATPase subunit type 1 TsaE [Accumulibacter sp.]MCM8594866.1 tRNA (adenosine(37)-N6)-threonylcarbamoyltransferase complex ATPase subunit type 1 TsaE [Accumulibacter sp.]MDS4049012.1 tRNA (adenosine(37)-N6)-threonylcarbamoyltransferase complex ATPase subunit type 1 TsaE [Accumulibacter sp.]